MRRNKEDLDSGKLSLAEKISALIFDRALGPKDIKREAKMMKSKKQTGLGFWKWVVEAGFFHLLSKELE